MPLTLHLGGAFSPKERHHPTPITQVRQRHPTAPPPVPHKPQYLARFRNLGKRGFPKLRREAASPQKRWEAKRPRTLPLTSENGS